MLSLKCPFCGGSLYFEKEHPLTFCPYCGSHLPDMTNYVQKAVDFEFTKQEHSMNMETMDKQIKREKINRFVQTSSNIAEIIKYIALVICLGLVVYFFIHLAGIIKH